MASGSGGQRRRYRAFVPKSIVGKPDHEQRTITRQPAPRGGLVYEVPVKAFSKLHPDIPEPLRGTLAAIAHPASIAHFKKLGVAAVELMPVHAWIDERHLAAAWPYQCLGLQSGHPSWRSTRALRRTALPICATVADALHAEGIALILDVVFNHTGESDVFGPTLSLRGLDNALYYRHHADEPGALINDTGTGNTLAVRTRGGA